MSEYPCSTIIMSRRCRVYIMNISSYFMALLIVLILNLKESGAKKIKTFRVSPEITTGWTFCRNQALYTS